MSPNEHGEKTARKLSGCVVTDILVAEGVKVVFGMPGGHVLGIDDGLYDRTGIATHRVRHEQQAPAPATGYFQLTGNVAVCLATAGPGATNLLTSAAKVFVGSIPMVILAGRGATTTTYRGASQQLPTEKVFAPVTKSAVRVDHAEVLPEAPNQALQMARNGKPGPVYIDIPRDLLAATVAVPDYVAAEPAPRVAADQRTFGRKRHRAQRNGLSKRLLGEADVVLGLGARFEEMENSWRPGFVPQPSALYVQVDIDPAEIARSVPTRLSLVGDLAMVLDQLNAELPLSGKTLEAGAFADHPRSVACRAALSAIRAGCDGLSALLGGAIPPVEAIRDVQRHAFGDRILDTDFSLPQDFVALAESCHCHGEAVTHADDLGPARARATNRQGRPAMVDVRVARAPSEHLRSRPLLRQGAAVSTKQQTTSGEQH